MRCPPQHDLFLPRAFGRSFVSDLCACLECGNDLRFYVGSGCCLDKKVSDDAIIMRENLSSIYAVAVEEPACEQYCCSLVALGESLGPSDSIGKNFGCYQRILVIVDTGERSLLDLRRRDRRTTHHPRELSC